jgi:thymidylate synthase (FAD)
MPLDTLDTIKVLDHGYVKLIASMGSDEAIVEAARMSTGRGFVSWSAYHRCRVCDLAEPERADGLRNSSCCIGSQPTGNPHDWQEFPRGDLAMLDFMWKNRHATPFEFGELHIEVQAPIFVFREWHRHRTQSYNEMSARYVPLPDVNYIPSVESQIRLKAIYAEAETLYQQALKLGVPKELARVHLPVGRYSKMVAKTDLRNWLDFLTLRMAAGAQWEIRCYAEAVAEIVKACWPRTYALFMEGKS